MGVLPKTALCGGFIEKSRERDIALVTSLRGRPTQQAPFEAYVSCCRSSFVVLFHR